MNQRSTNRPPSRSQGRAPQRSQGQRRQVATQQNNRRHNRRYRRNYTASYIFGGILVVAIGVVLSLTIFFNMGQVVVEGGGYTSQEVLEMTDLTIGTNLFQLNTKDIENDLMDAIPDASEIVVTVDLPDVLHVEITVGEVVATCYSNGSFYSISESQRIVAIDNSLPDTAKKLFADLDLAGYEVGDFLSGSNSIAQYLEVIEALEEMELYDITQMEIDEVGDITLLYQDRITIELGSDTDLDYKLQIVKQVLEEHIEDGQEGVIDASIASMAYFRPMTMAMQYQEGRALDVLRDHVDELVDDSTDDTADDTAEEDGEEDGEEAVE